LTLQAYTEAVFVIESSGSLTVYSRKASPP